MPSVHLFVGLVSPEFSDEFSFVCSADLSMELSSKFSVDISAKFSPFSTEFPAGFTLYGRYSEVKIAAGQASDGTGVLVYFGY